jgi:hypothetical protein
MIYGSYSQVNMKIQKTREIVIEYERVQIIRKRAKTHLVYCEECRTFADFVSLAEATTLFNTASKNLLEFIKRTGSHYQTENCKGIFICLNSLLTQLREKADSAGKILTD